MSDSKKTSGNMRVYRMAFGTVYPLYVKKAERKGRTRQEVDSIITWLTGYSEEEIRSHLESGIDFETFFARAPLMNPNASLITGTICGYRVEDIDDPILRKVRCLDKLIDELSKGRAMEKILRVPHA